MWTDSWVVYVKQSHETDTIAINGYSAKYLTIAGHPTVKCPTSPHAYLSLSTSNPRDLKATTNYLQVFFFTMILHLQSML